MSCFIPCLTESDKISFRGVSAAKDNTMQFSVSESINSLNGHLYDQSFPNFSSTPAKERINPGLVFQMYTDVVPLHYANDLNLNAVHQKKDTDGEMLQSQQNENQTGSGYEDLIKHSFQHPRPIQTEVLLPVKKSKRKNDINQDGGAHTGKKIKHKFQFF